MPSDAPHGTPFAVNSRPTDMVPTLDCVSLLYTWGCWWNESRMIPTSLRLESLPGPAGLNHLRDHHFGTSWKPLKKFGIPGGWLDTRATKLEHAWTKHWYVFSARYHWYGDKSRQHKVWQCFLLAKALVLQRELLRFTGDVGNCRVRVPSLILQAAPTKNKQAGEVEWEHTNEHGYGSTKNGRRRQFLIRVYIYILVHFNMGYPSLTQLIGCLTVETLCVCVPWSAPSLARQSHPGF